MRDLRHIRHHLDLDSAKLLATALVSSHLDYCNSLLYGIADIDLTRLQRIQNQLARLVTKSPSFNRSLPLLRSLQWLPVKLEYCLRSICWPSKPCMKNSLFIFTPCLPHRFLPVHWDQTMIIICQSLGSRPILVQEPFTLLPHLFGTTSHCLSVQPFQLLPLRNIWRHISLTWPFPHRYHHSPWSVDVTELFPRFCCWTLIWLSHHWVWLCWGYWHYRSLIDWLINHHFPLYKNQPSIIHLYRDLSKYCWCIVANSPV